MARYFSKTFLAWLLVLTLFPGFAALVQAEPSTLRVLTFNAWILGLPFGTGAKDIDARVTTMPAKLAETQAEVIALQEVWNESHRDRLVQGMKKHGYAAIFFTKSGIGFGSGLILFTKLPQEGTPDEMHFTRYTRSDEAFAAKGGLHAVISFDGGCFDFYDTHLGAVSFLESEGIYSEAHRAIRIEQAKELVTWIHSNKKCDTQILGGDLNANFFTYLRGEQLQTFGQTYRLFVEKGFESLGLGWIDTFGLLNNRTKVDCTFCKENLYVGEGRFAASPDEAIDYIFISTAERLRPVRSEILFKENLPEIGHPLSDHYGVLTTFHAR